MPFYIRKLPNKDLYRVINRDEPGKKYSKEGQIKRIALRQLRILQDAAGEKYSPPKVKKSVPTRAVYEKGSEEALEWSKKMHEIKRSRKLQATPPFLE